MLNEKNGSSFFLCFKKNIHVFNFLILQTGASVDAGNDKRSNSKVMIPDNGFYDRRRVELGSPHHVHAKTVSPSSPGMPGSIDGDALTQGLCWPAMNSDGVILDLTDESLLNYPGELIKQGKLR